MLRMILSDDPWDRIKPYLPGKASDCGVTAANNRLSASAGMAAGWFVEAVLWIARTGTPHLSPAR